MSIQELIAAIRVLQAANAEYEASCEEPIEVDGFTGYKTTPRRIAAIKALDAAAMEVIHDVHNDDVLAALVALADEIERLRLIEERMVLTWRTNDEIRRIARKEDLDPYGVHLTALTRCNIIANCLGYEPEAE